MDGSTTVALALARAGEIVVANVGDSRAYWMGDDGQTVLLSVDDSWTLRPGSWLTGRRGPGPGPPRHEITAWLGPDADPVVPHLAVHACEGGGLLLLCSDGLWNYAESPDSMGDLVNGAGTGGRRPWPPSGPGRHRRRGGGQRNRGRPRPPGPGHQTRREEGS